MMHVALLVALAAGPPRSSAAPPQYAHSPFAFTVSVPRADPRAAAMLLLGDLDDDGETDYLLMSDAGTAAYGHDGRPLWTCRVPPRYNAREPADWVRDDPDALRPMQSDLHGVVADVDADGHNEFVFLDRTGYQVVVLAGATGREERRIDLRAVFGAARPFTHVCAGRLFRRGEDSSLVVVSHFVHVPFQGKDSVLAFDYRDPSPARFWRHDDLFGASYAPARVVDLDGDGWDEVLTGLEAFDRRGRLLWRVDGKSDQYTTLQVGDLLPAPGLEAIVGEYGHAGTDRGLYVNGAGRQGRPGVAERLELSQNTHSAMIGHFLAGKRTGQALLRSNTHTGREDVRDHRLLDLTAPPERREIAVPRLDTLWKDNAEEGRAMAEYPRPIDWDGDEEMAILAVERHVPNPRASVHRWRTGERIATMDRRGMMEAGVRVCDVSGDGREEVLVWNAREVAVYFDEAPSRRPDAPIRRRDRLYRRLKSAGNVLYNPP